MRFSYDSTKLKPSSVQTNVITDDETEYFEFEDEFKECLEFFTIPYDETGTGIKGWLAFDPPVNETEHIIEKDGIGKVIVTNENLLLGRMSFQMTAEEFSTDWFSLVESTPKEGNAKLSVPITGIKIMLDGTKNFQAQSTFRFTEELASKNANLKNLILSKGKVDEENPENSTYKEYELTPEFDKDTLEYEVTLMEYLDTMDIKAVLEDETSTMKIKVPKRDEDDKLLYEDDGVTITTEEKDLENDTPLEFVLNKLGEPDTELVITVTAEDGKTTKEYKLVIKRPYATLIGQDILANFDSQDVVDNILDIYGVEVNHMATINLYKPDLARWEELPDIYQQVYDEPMTYEDIEQIPKETSFKTNLDGTFEVYIIPGSYDIQVTRLAYLDYIYSDVEAEAGDIIDMGTFRLEAGDANRDGIVTQEDINEIGKNLDKEVDSENGLEVCNSSQIGIIVAEDLDYVNKSQDKELQIVYFSKQ